MTGEPQPTLPQAPTPADPGQQESLARYPITGQLGAGGMGDVLEVRDEQLERVVAAKILRGHDPELARKFEREARITGGLAHPNIIPVYELGRAIDGRAYFTMKRIEGQDLDARLASDAQLPEGQQRAALAERLAILVKICEAMEFAHDRGVIHRDLKPSNVMLGRFGETMVVDWGLAKVLGAAELGTGSDALPADPLQTLDGTIVGTPAFMPPEQAAGMIAELDERSDVYSLGAILYQMIALRPPFEGGVVPVLDAVAAGRVVPPPGPHELRAVVLRAMAFEQGARYPTVAALRADVERYLRGELLAAVRYSPWERTTRWASRHAAGVTAAAAVLLIGLLVAAGAALRIDRARRDESRAHAVARRAVRVARVERSRAEQAQVKEQGSREAAEAALRQSNAHLAEALLYKAEVAQRERRSLQAIAYVAAAREVHDSPEGWMASLMLGQAWLRPTAVWPGGSGRLAVAADASWIALVDTRQVTVLDPSTGRVQGRFAHRMGPPYAVVGGPGGLLAIGGGRGQRIVRVFDVAKGEERGRFAVGGPVMDVAFSPDGKQLVAAGGNPMHSARPTVRHARIYNLARGEPGPRLGPLDGDAIALAWSRDGVIAVAHNNLSRRILRFEASSGKALTGLPSRGLTVRSGMCFSSDSSALIVAKDPGRIEIFDTRKRTLSGTLNTGRRIKRIQIDHDTLLASAERSIHVWGWPARQRIQRLMGRDAVLAGDSVVFAMRGNALWRFDGPAAGSEYRGHDLYTRPMTLPAVRISPDGELIATCNSGVVRVWTLRTGALRHTLWGALGAAAFLPDGRLATTTSDHDVLIWDPRSGKRLRRIDGPARMPIAASDDGALLAASSPEGLAIYDLARGTRQLVPCKQALHVEFAPRSHRLAASGMRGEVWIVDADARRVERSLTAHRTGARALAFAPDGSWVVSTGDDGRIHVSDARTGVLIKAMRAARRATACAVTPDGKRLAVGTSGGAILIWDTDNWTRRSVLTRLHNGWVRGLAFAPDGEIMVSSAGDSTLKVWGLDAPRAAAAVRATGLQRDGATLVPLTRERFGRLARGASALTPPWQTRSALREMDEAIRAVERRDYRQAERTLDALIAHTPDWVSARMLRARLRRSRLDVDAAIADADAVIRADPGYTRGHEARAAMLLDKGDLDGAERDNREALRLSPRRLALRSQRADIRRRKGDHRGAIADLDAVIRRRSSSPALYLRGRSHEANGNLDAALADYEAAHTADTKMWQAASYAARILIRRGKKTRALTLLRSARQHAPVNQHAQIDAAIKRLGG